MSESTAGNQQPFEKKCKQYPYFRLSTYEIYGSEGYEVLCGMFLKYYAEKVPVCLAFHGTAVNPKQFIAIWLIGKEAFDPKTKSIPNSEPMGEILWCSDWPDSDDKEVKVEW